MDAPDACVAPFSGSGAPGFTCGRFAGRLGAIFGAPRFTPGFPADGFGATSVNFATVGATFTGAFAAGFAAGFGASFGATFGVTFGVTFAVGDLATGFFATGFGAGFFAAGFFSGGAEKMRERRPFFSATGGHELHKVRNTTAVAPLVVVPGDHLGEVIAEQHGARRVDDCGARVPTEVGGDERLI